ncbi:MAG: glycosyltransferase [Terracidiphilus sp.]
MTHIVLLIPTVDRIGGAERQVILLAKGLLKRGWRVTVVALSGTGGPAAGQLVAEGAEFPSLEMRKGLADPRGWIRFNRWLRREKPDVVHAHLPHATWFMRWSRLAAPVRVALDTIHTSATGTTGRRLGYRLSDWLPDRVTAVSKSVAIAYLSARMVSESRLTVVPNGVEVDHWRPDPAVRTAVRRELGLSDEFLWFAAGRLEPVKDYPALLRAMTEVPKPAQLVIAGEGALDLELRRLTAELDLNMRVRFLGFEPDVRRWMQAADGFVLSSRWEGLPIAMLEAAACALPAVATDVAGSSEIIMHGHTGLLAAAGNQTALAAAMTRLVQMSPEERGAMGERAQQLVTERFQMERVLDQWEKLYAELLDQNPMPLRRGPRR